MRKAIHRETNKSRVDSSEELMRLQKEKQNEMLREQLKSIKLDKYFVSKSRNVILEQISFPVGDQTCSNNRVNTSRSRA